MRGRGEMNGNLGEFLLTNDEGRLILHIPIKLFNGVAAFDRKKTINRFHADVFNGSYIFWGSLFDDYYAIELKRDASEEDILRLIDLIENNQLDRRK